MGFFKGAWFFCITVYTLRTCNACSQYIKILDGDTCEDVQQAFPRDRSQLIELNPNLNCDPLQPNSYLCIASNDHMADWRAEANRNCPGPFVVVLEGDTCRKIGMRIDVTQEHFMSYNSDVDCDQLSAGNLVCGAPMENSNSAARGVPEGDRRRGNSSAGSQNNNNRPSGQPTNVNATAATKCPGKFVTANGNETCAHFRDRHNIASEEEFRELNPTLSCDGLVERGRIVCIRKPRLVFMKLPFRQNRFDSTQFLQNSNCTKWYQAVAKDTCWTVRTAAKLTEEAFAKLNPSLDCSKILPPGQRVCLADASTYGKPCRLTYTVPGGGQTCQQLATIGEMTVQQLKTLNPTLNCNSRVPEKTQLCLSYEDVFETGSSGTRGAFLSSASTRLTQRGIVDAETAERIRRLLNATGTEEDDRELASTLASVQSIPLIKSVVENDQQLSRMAAAFDRRRSIICAQLTESSTAYKICICDNDKPFIHCQAILMTALNEQSGSGGEQNLPDNEDTARMKRHTVRHARHKNQKRSMRHGANRHSTSRNDNLQNRLSASDLSNAGSKVAACFADFWRYFQRLCPNCLENVCFGVGKCFIIPQAPVFEVCVSGGACMPNPATLITSDGRLSVNQFFTSSVSFSTGICITGVSAVFNLVGLAACVASVDFRYYYLRQQFEIQPQIALVAVRAYLNALVQVAESYTSDLYDSENNLPLMDLCQEEAYQCSDFCQLQPGGSVVDYHVEVWFFGWRSVKKGDIKPLPECKPHRLPVPDTLHRLVLFTTNKAQHYNSSNRPDYCRYHALTPKDIPASVKATHIIYGYLSIDARTFRLADPQGNDYRLIGELGALKNANARLMISVGGPSACDNASISVFSTLVRAQANRRAFVESTIRYLRSHALHGVDLAWTCPNRQDKDYWSIFIREFRKAIDASGGDLLLTVSAPALPKYYANVDWAKIHKDLDFINLMTLDYHGPNAEDRGDVPNVHAPAVDCSCSAGGDLELTVEAYLNAGVPSSKLNLGLSTYGRAFKLNDQGKVTGQAYAGECTDEEGLLAWYEIKTRIDDMRVDVDAMAAYSLYGDNEWVGYENQVTHAMKICFARRKILGGLTVWNADLDDRYELIENIDKSLTTDCENVDVSTCENSGSTEPEAEVNAQMERSRFSLSSLFKPRKKPSKDNPICASFSGQGKQCKQAACSSPPSIKNGDKAKMSRCSNKAVGQTCTVECLSGYAPTVNAVSCVRLFSSFAMWLPPSKCEQSAEERQRCGDGPTPVVTVSSGSRNGSTAYLVKYNLNARTPLWSMYASKGSNTNGRRHNRFLLHSCHRDYQRPLEAFRKNETSSKYAKCPLSPYSAFSDTKLAHYMINVAAQERRTRFGPWRVLERRVDGLLGDSAGLVATGQCPITIDRPEASSDSPVVSSCIWKMICVKTTISGDTTTSVAVFYHENGEVGSARNAMAARIAQLKTVRNQVFLVEKLRGTATNVDDIWLAGKRLLIEPSNRGGNGRDYPTSEECAAKMTLGDEEISFWNSFLQDENYGPSDWDRFDSAESDEELRDTETVESAPQTDLQAYGIRKTPYERCGRTINALTNVQK